MTLTLFAVYEQFSDMYIKEFIRLEQGIRHKKELMGQALSNAASVLSPEQKSDRDFDHLFNAFSTVCREVGCEAMPCRHHLRIWTGICPISLSTTGCSARKVCLSGSGLNRIAGLYWHSGRQLLWH